MTATELVITNARIVLAERVIERGHVVVEGGRIVAVEAGTSQAVGGKDLGGDLLIPGLVELHTDHLEAHFMPRSGVLWDAGAAVLAYDAQIVAAGITTVFDSLRCGSYEPVDLVADETAKLAGAIEAAGAAGMLRAEHLLHLRCELTAPEAADVAQGLLRKHEARLISLMDHTPGQRQVRDLDRIKGYYRRRGELDEAGIEALIAERIARGEENSGPQRKAIVALARQHGAVLASHDDASRAHVAEAVADGVAIAEFPTTLEAAEASHAAGIRVLMGAPNLVRGGSHSGNVAAIDLVRRGSLDIVSSDYIPASLLVAVGRIVAMDAGFELPSAVALVTRNPAEAAGLHDRGEIAVGKRADLVHLGRLAGRPVVRAVWRAGERVF